MGVIAPEPVSEMLGIETRSCIKSKDDSFLRCFDSVDVAKRNLSEIIDEIKDDSKAWELAIGDDTRYGKDGIEHIAMDTASGRRIGVYEGDNFSKHYRRFRYLLERCDYDAELKEMLER